MITKENADRLIKLADEINGIMSLEDFDHDPNFDEDENEITIYAWTEVTE